MQDYIASHYGLWGTAFLWTVLTGAFLLFLPFYRPVQRKPSGFFAAYAFAFAFEMYGIPFSLYLVLGITGRYLPVGVLWGYTLSRSFGMAGHYLYVAALLAGGSLVVAGWAMIYRNEWVGDEWAGDGGGINEKDRAEDCAEDCAEDLAPDKEAPRLVQSGVYRYVRHPQYSGLLIIALGALLEWATIPLLVLWPMLVRQYVLLARREDRKMALRFGDEWREYARTTGMFMPRISCSPRSRYR